jgi:ribA/ribD-fused uncharacterized protein
VSNEQKPNPVERRDGFVLFWSGWPSNWFPSTFVVDGVLFNCGEQWMMWSKAKLFDDAAMMKAILAEPSPREQKALGRQVSGYDDDKWKSVARDVVYRGLLEKFRQNPDLKQQLLATGADTIVEASPKDALWGIGLHQSDARATQPEMWRGSNWLGEVLMRVREALRDETTQFPSEKSN